MEPKILTKSGIYFDLVNPNPDDVCIEDIAAALGKLCRFTGHTKHFYSVAQHCLLVSHNAPQHLKLHALLHDASEAYLGDVSSPLKQLIPMYKVLEENVQAAVNSRFKLPTLSLEDAELIRELDLRALKTEKGLYMPKTDVVWPVCDHLEPFNVQFFQALNYWQAECSFIQVFNKLIKAEKS